MCTCMISPEYKYIIPKQSLYTRIPLNLFQTWHTRALPPFMQRCVQRMISENPEFTYRFYDDANCRSFIETHFDEDVLRAYDRLIPGTYKADLWRYCILYIHGGIYADIKYQCVPPFKLVELTSHEHYVRDRDFCGNHGVYQGLLVSYPKNIILYQCIRKIVEYTNTLYYGYTCLFVGPQLIGSYFCQVELQAMELAYTGSGIDRSGKRILTMYPEYRKELSKHARTKHYTDLWMDREVYEVRRMKAERVIMLRMPRHGFRSHPIWVNHENGYTLYTQWSTFMYTQEGRVYPATRPVYTQSHVSLEYEEDQETVLQGFESLSVHHGYFIGYNRGMKGGCIDSMQSIDTFYPSTHEKWCQLEYKGAPCIIQQWNPIQICTLEVNRLIKGSIKYTGVPNVVSATNGILWKGEQWVIVSRYEMYQKAGVPYQKVCHQWVVLDKEVNVLRTSEFFKLEEESIISHLHIDTQFKIGYTACHGKCCIAMYTQEEVESLRWNHREAL